MSSDIYKPQTDEFYSYVYFNPQRKTPQFPNGTPFYVGKGQHKRAFDHLNTDHRDAAANNYKRNTIRKLQRNGLNPTITCAWYGTDEQYAYRVEKLLIAMWGRADLGKGPLTNLTDGGEGDSGRIVSDETRRKMSEGKRTEEARLAIVESNRRRRGEKRSEEAKKKASELARKLESHKHFPDNTGRKATAEHRQKISDANRGKVMSKESRKKMRTPDEVLNRITTLRAAGISHQTIAETLNSEGFRTRHGSKEFNATNIKSMCYRMKTPPIG